MMCIVHMQLLRWLCCVQAAADTLATISWVSRFSTATKSGAGGVLVSFSWEVAADPESYG
jgi:hypothetical protein